MAKKNKKVANKNPSVSDDSLEAKEFEDDWSDDPEPVKTGNKTPDSLNRVPSKQRKFSNVKG